MTTESKTCDVCGRAMYKDTGAWMGGHVVVNAYEVRDLALLEHHERDVCPECMKAVRVALGVK